jgi:hypothetical protein
MPDGICQTEGYTISLKIRKRIEKVLGWMKTVGGMRKLRPPDPDDFKMTPI